MNFFTIFFLVIVAIVSGAEASGEKCKKDKDCYPQIPLGIRYFCDEGTKTCFSRQVVAPEPTDKSCDNHKDCRVHLLGVRGFCNPATKTCFLTQVIASEPTDRKCETRRDCYRRLVGVKYICDTETETCATEPLV